MYDSLISVGDRIAIAPHHDLWMAGVRFGVVTEIRSAIYARGRLVNLIYAECNGRVHCFTSDDLLGAIR